MKICAICHALDGQLVAVSMQMAVIAPGDPVFFQQRQNLRAGIAPVARRIVQEAILLPLPRRLQRRLQSYELPVQDLGIVLPAVALLFKKPASGTAQGDLAVKIGVVIEQMQIGKAVLLAKALKFCRRDPPVIVVALEDDLPARDAGKIRKIRRRRLIAQLISPSRTVVSAGPMQERPRSSFCR